MGTSTAALTLSRRGDHYPVDAFLDYRRGEQRPATAGAARVRLLGTVDVVVDGVVREVPGARRKAVLAVLALHAGGTVNTDLITEVVWEGRPPSTAANTLQRHVSHLRGVLGGKGSIVAVPPGYRLQLGVEATDVWLAEQIIERARRSPDPAETAERLRSALVLWRGEPLTGLSGAAWFSAQADRLERVRTDAMKALAQARLALGEHALMLPELEELAFRNPFDEDIRAQLMLALYRSGRQADALQAYHELHTCLDEVLGIEPSPPLRDLQLAILRHDPSIAAPFPAGITVSHGPAGAAVGSLPPMDTALVGRQAELRCLDDRLLHDRSATAVVAMSGPAGAGKTTLAVQWSRRASGKHFPDGQIYIDLRGSIPGGALEPAEAVRRALVALGVPGHDLPTGIDALSGLYRTLLARRRILVVLDDAFDAQQVLPLLPNSAESAVLVASRRRLTGLVVAQGAHCMTLEPLTQVDASGPRAGGRAVGAVTAGARQ